MSLSRLFMRFLQTMGALTLFALPMAAHAGFSDWTFTRTPPDLKLYPGQMDFDVHVIGDGSTSCATPAEMYIEIVGEGFDYFREAATSTWDFVGTWDAHWSFNFPDGAQIYRITLDCDNFMEQLWLFDTTNWSPWKDPIVFTDDVFLVVDGGTGANTFTTNGVLFGNATSSIQATAAGSQHQILRVSASGTPEFGALDLSQSVAVTGTLPVIRGGTGTATAFTSGSLVFAGSGGAYIQDNGNLFWDDTNNRLGIGTSSPQSRLEVNGTAAALHQKGIGSAPSVAAGTGAGTGGTASIVGTDSAGRVSVTLGVLPATDAPTAVVTFATAYATPPYVVFSPANLDTTALTGSRAVHVTSTTSGFTIMSGTLALLASGDLEWNYQVVE